MKKIYFLLRIISFCLIAFFLMLVLDQNTLTTTLQRFFIFSYFFGVMLILYKFIFIRYCIQDKKTIFYALLVAFILSCGLGKNYLPQKDVESIVRIEVQNKKNEHSQGYEVWISGIKKNNYTVDINDYIINYSNYENRDNSIFMLGEQQTEFIDLRLSSGYQYTLVVGQHAWSGIIKIYFDDNLYKQYDLYSKEAQTMDIVLLPNKVEWGLNYFLILFFGRYLLLFYGIIFILSFMKSKQCLNNRKLISIYILILAYCFRYNLIYDSFVFIYLISFLLWNYIFKYQNKYSIKNYFKRIPIGIILINIYITFSFVGASIFLPIHKTEIYFRDLILFLIWNIIILPFSYFFVILMEKYMCISNQKKVKNINENKHYKSLYIIPFVILGIVLCILNPGLMTPDSFDQYAQAHGLAKFHDHHPIFHTFIEMILYKIYDSPMIIAIAQILFFSFVCGQISNYFIKNGYKKSTIFILTILFSILPTNLINIVTLWKDISFSIAILYMSYLLARISIEKKYFFTLSNSILLGIDLLLIGFVRHGSLIISFIVIGYIFVIMVYNKTYNKMIVPILYLGITILIKISLPVYLDPTPNGNVITVVPLHGIAYVNYEKKLDDKQAIQLLENYMPLDKWEKLYEPSSANAYMYSEDALEFQNIDKFRITPINPVIKTYIHTLKKNPYLILKDRLYGTDLLWNINQADYSYNYRYAFDSFEEESGYGEYGISHKKNYFEDVIFKYMELSYKYKILDNVLWRVGIYLNLIILFIYIIIRNKMYYKLIAFLPVTLNTAILFIAMAWQDYRYVYYIFITFGFLYFFTLSNNIMVEDDYLKR